MPPKQLALPFGFDPDLAFNRFHVGANGEIVDHLKRAANGDGERLIFLWGPHGSGKSHLLNACCQLAAAHARTLAYLPFASFVRHGPYVLDGLEHHDLVCWDDLDELAGLADWEAALFDQFNQLRDNGATLLICAKQPPGQLGIALPDLDTRLGWGLTLKLKALGDDDKLAALQTFAAERGLNLPEPAARFLLTHQARDLPSLRRLVDELDHASLAARSRLTVTFIKTYLEQQA